MEKPKNLNYLENDTMWRKTVRNLDLRTVVQLIWGIFCLVASSTLGIRFQPNISQLFHIKVTFLKFLKTIEI